MNDGGPLTRLGLDAESRELRQRKIVAGVLASVYRQVPQSVLGSIVGGVALVAVFWNTHDQTTLVAWFVAVLLESLLRLRAARSFRRLGGQVADVAGWSTRWVLMAGTAGALWGAAGVMFYAPQSPLLQLVLVAVILGVAFGSLTLYAGHRPALIAFLPLALLPLIGRIVMQQDPAYYTAALVVLAVFSFTMFFGRNFGVALADAVKNNYENEVLVSQLLAEKRIAEDARRGAENATRSKTQFFAAASHDLRQPLQAIGIYSALLRKRAPPPLEPLVRNLSGAVESLSKLVEELLEISRLDSGTIQPRIQQVVLDDMFAGLEQEFTPLAASKRLQLRARHSGLAIVSDPLLMQRVLRNLLANAVRYTQRGGVLLAARKRNGLVSIEVWDTGPGIQQQELDRIFEEFYRGESARVEGSVGYGLGLSIVRRICGALGHPLVVTTRPGSGSVFRVEAPGSAAPQRGRRPVADAGEAKMRGIGGHTVVVLEDNEAILNSLARLLRSWGADVVSAPGYTAQLVRRLTQDRAVDLVIADQNLGGAVGGVEAAFRIREIIGFPVPVIMLTAVPPLDVMAEFQHQMRLRIEAHPEAAPAIARSRVEEPIVLTKPAQAALLNSTVVEALGLSTVPEGELALAGEGREERMR